MELIEMLLQNKVLITAGLAWCTAGIIKMIIEFIVYKRLSFERIIGAGGMPSSHTATVVALALITGYDQGIRSVSFAITVIFAIVVIHDAVGVRLETGKQAKVLNTMMFDSKAFQDLDFENQLKEYIGHTPAQAVAGAVIGFIVAIIMMLKLY